MLFGVASFRDGEHKFNLFQWAPTLGGECYFKDYNRIRLYTHKFQWAPTLGGECYDELEKLLEYELAGYEFLWAPTLGGECYRGKRSPLLSTMIPRSFNGHPPLGVNATPAEWYNTMAFGDWFQWAPTLGGECYFQQ